MTDLNILRHYSRKLIRELAILELSKDNDKATPQRWHALIDISQNPQITVSRLAQNLVMHISSVSRLLNSLLDDGLVKWNEAADGREKKLQITKKGEAEIQKIDKFSNIKILNAFRFLGAKDQEQIFESIKKYADALEKSRIKNQIAKIKILTLSSSRALRCQVRDMIMSVQNKEFDIEFLPEDEIYIMQAEKAFYYKNSCNFWYAVDAGGKVIGSIALKKISKHEGEVKKFFVCPEYRGQKVAQALMLKLAQAAQKHKFNIIYLGTMDKLKAAQAFYSKVGFELIAKNSLPNYYEKCILDNLFYKAKTSELLKKINSSN